MPEKVIRADEALGLGVHRAFRARESDEGCIPGLLYNEVQYKLGGAWRKCLVQIEEFYDDGSGKPAIRAKAPFGEMARMVIIKAMMASEIVAMQILDGLVASPEEVREAGLET